MRRYAVRAIRERFANPSDRANEPLVRIDSSTSGSAAMFLKRDSGSRMRMATSCFALQMTRFLSRTARRLARHVDSQWATVSYSSIHREYGISSHQNPSSDLCQQICRVPAQRAH